VQLFWLGIFSLTAKAALSISFDGEKAALVHLFCFSSVLYSYIVDVSIFRIEFDQNFITIGLCIVVFSMASLIVRSISERQQEEQEDLSRQQRLFEKIKEQQHTVREIIVNGEVILLRTNVE